MIPMKSISELDAAIISFKAKQASDLVKLKEELKYMQKSLSPANIIKSAFTEITSSTDPKGGLFSMMFNFMMSFILKKIRS
jgi:hypothetical protein